MILIDFEGIDGSGKSTLSQMLERELAARGITVFHTRGNDELQSELSAEIRELSRNPNRLTMSTWTEALLYLARENQLLEEKIFSYKDKDAIVISDRFFYSHFVLSSYVRGLDPVFFQSLVKQLSHGIEPDLVFLCDVDIVTSQTRKKIQDLKDATYNDFGRKGLSGIALREKTREGFLSLAQNDTKRWRVIDNMSVTLADAYSQIIAEVDKQFTAQVKASGQKPLEPKRDRHVTQVIGTCDLNMDSIEQIFYSTLQTLHPDYQCYYLDSIGSRRSYQIRKSLIDTAPAMVAGSCNKLLDDHAFDLFEKLQEKYPEQVLLAQNNRPPIHPRSIKIREQLATQNPALSLYMLRGINEEWGWKIRRTHAAEYPRETLISLAGIDTAEAWRIREQYNKKKFASELLYSVQRIDSEQAWRIRSKYGETHPAYALISIHGIGSAKAHALRNRFMALAPKLVAASLNGLIDDESWSIRQHCFNAYPQVLSSIKHISVPQADTIRKSLYDRAPAQVIDSLGMLYNRTALQENPWITMGWDQHRNYFPFIKKIIEREDKRARVYATRETI